MCRSLLKTDEIITSSFYAQQRCLLNLLRVVEHSVNGGCVINQIDKRSIVDIRDFLSCPIVPNQNIVFLCLDAEINALEPFDPSQVEGT